MKIAGIEKHSKLISIIFLSLFILFFLIQNYLFIVKDSKPGYTDGHIIRAARYYDALVLKNDEDLSQVQYPPFLYLVTLVFFKTGGFSLLSARLSLLFFSFLFLLAMFGIGYELGGYYAGAVVLSLAASSPHILDFSRHYFPDFPQTAVTAAAFYFLLKSDFFKNRRFSVLFAISLSLAFLTKWSTAFFMIVPVMWYFFPALRYVRNNLRSLLVILPLAVFCMGGTLWYFQNVSVGDKLLTDNWLAYYLVFIAIPGIVCLAALYLLERKYKEHFSNPENLMLNNFAIMSVTFAILTSFWYYYAAETMKDKFFKLSLDTVTFEGQRLELSSFYRSIFSIFPFFILMVIIGFVLIFIFRKENLYRNLMLPANLVFITLLMLKITCPGSRYLLSIIIFAAALGGYWIARTKKYRFPVTLIVVSLSVLSILSWAVISVPFSPPPFLSNIISVSSYAINWNEIKPVTMFRSFNPIQSNFKGSSEAAINYLFSKEEPCNKILIIFCNDFDAMVFPREFFEMEAFRISKNIQTDFDWPADEFLRITNDKFTSCTPLFEKNDFGEKFIVKLKQGDDGFTAFINKNLAPRSREIIRNYTPGNPPSQEMIDTLVSDLNNILINRNFLHAPSVINEVGRLNITDMELWKSGKGYYLVMNRIILDRFYSAEISRKYEPEPRLDWALNHVDGVVVLSSESNYIDPVMKKITTLFPGAEYREKTFNLGDGFRITAIKIIKSNMK